MLLIFVLIPLEELVDAFNNPLKNLYWKYSANRNVFALSRFIFRLANVYDNINLNSIRATNLFRATKSVLPSGSFSPSLKDTS